MPLFSKARQIAPRVAATLTGGMQNLVAAFSHEFAARGFVIRYARKPGRAPQGGVTIDGTFYPGGTFVPGKTQREVNAAATTQQPAAATKRVSHTGPTEPTDKNRRTHKRVPEVFVNGQWRVDVDKLGSDTSTQVRRLAELATQRRWSKKVQQQKVPGNLWHAFTKAMQALALAENPAGFHAKMSNDEKATARRQREREEAHRADQQRKAFEKKDAAKAALKKGLPPAQWKQVMSLRMLDDRSPGQIEAYVKAALSWQHHDPSTQAIQTAVTALKHAGVKMEQKGRHNSYYGRLSDGRTVRVGNHLGFDAHDVDFVFDDDAPLTKDTVLKNIQETFAEHGLGHRG